MEKYTGHLQPDAKQRRPICQGDVYLNLLSLWLLRA
jgi:hypothetical protein